MTVFTFSSMRTKEDRLDSKSMTKVRRQYVQLPFSVGKRLATKQVTVK